LTSENRALVSLGLPGIPSSVIPGLKILYEGTRRQDNTEPVSARDVAFGMAPTVNAAGRLGDPYVAARLLMAKDDDTAWRFFRSLDRMNKERRKIQNAITDRLMQLPEVAWSDTDAGVLVLVDPDCIPGLAGLAAVRLAESTGRPSMVLAPGKDDTGPLYRGSMRTFGGENLLELMEPARELTESQGGHSGALGVTVRPENLDDFLEVSRSVKWTPAPGRLEVDFAIGDVPSDPGRIRELDATRPWGAGNPQPSFIWEPVTIESTRAVGRQSDHLQVSLQSENGSIMKGIGFSMARYFDGFDAHGQHARTAGQFILNSWRGKTSVEFQLSDIEFV
jgi:single-stranded-DNA-specific exonuclease